MNRISKIVITGVLVLSVTAFANDSCCPVSKTSNKVATKIETINQGKKIALNDGNYFVYKFSAKPALGNTVLIFKVFDANNKQITPYTIKGAASMPSMAGAHDSDATIFKLNKKKDYLLPVGVVMQGEWVIHVTVEKGSTPIFKGVIPFSV